MIRLSQNSDINDIILLWNEAFGDSEDDIKFFLDERFISDNTIVYECDGKIVSVLFLLEGDMHIKGTDYPSYYLYAACTLKAYRGKGIMADMLEYAALLSKERDNFFIALKPAEESLYSYYSKFGYKTVFSKKIADIKYNSSGTINEFSDLAINYDYRCLRNNAFSDLDYFKWNGKAIDFAIKHHKYFGGKFFSSSDGYVLYSEFNNTIYVKESTFLSIDKLADSFKRKGIANEFDSIQIDLPYDIYSENCKVVNSGMLLALNSTADKLIQNLSGAYLNLTLD